MNDARDPWEELVGVLGDAAVRHAPFGARTTYRVGGTARLLCEVATLDELRACSAIIASSHLAMVVLGRGSNMLVADGEFDGVVIVLAGQFARLNLNDQPDGSVLVECGAALSLPALARQLAALGVVGFEWAVGVPGSIGGAAVMNAGGHGSDMARHVDTLTTWSVSRGDQETWDLARLDYGYRSSALRAEDVVTSVTLRLARGDASEARARIADIVAWRREHQPGGSNAGSVFTNPRESAAGALIETAGLKGRRVGSAHVSLKHANFIQVDDGGSANDVRQLMELVRETVAHDSGVHLVSEIRTVGFGTPSS